MESLINDWNELLIEEFQKPYFKRLQELLVDEYRTKDIYPSKQEILSALEYTDYQSVKVVILGQDPYHGPNQAHGLSFSVKDNVKLPPSLKNIFKELQADLGYDIPNTGNLTYWAKQGVLLLNTVLTVRAGEPNSHKNIGWENFTDRIISLLNLRKKPVVFILWGKHAQDKIELIDGDMHYIITSPHPSPFSANKGFFGSKPFSNANNYLKKIGVSEIDWQLTNP